MRKPNKPKRHTRGLSKFKRTDLTKAALAAGLPVRGIDIDPVTGRIRVLIGDPASETKRADANPWDETNAEDEKRTA
jgi:hypothetical protein